MHNLLQATEKSLCLFSIGNWTYLTDDTAFSSSVAAGGTLICILTYNVTSEYSIYTYTYYIWDCLIVEYCPCNCAHTIEGDGNTSEKRTRLTRSRVAVGSYSFFFFVDHPICLSA